MKYLLLVALLIPAFVCAQSGKRDVLNPNQLGTKQVKLEAQKAAPPEIKLPFKRIRIIDSRFDTSKIGYVLSTDPLAGKKRSFRKLVLEGGSGNAIEKYYNEYYTGSFTPNDFELLIVMKRFWLAGDPRSNNKRVEITNSVGSNNNVYCKWEYYLGKDGKYLPVKRIDSIIKFKEELAIYVEDKFSGKKISFLKHTLKALIEVLDYSNAVKQFESQSKKTLTDIHVFNQKTNSLPVLQNDNLKKGVYLSFDDFKNDKPSIIDFRERKMHYGRINQNTENYLETANGETISNYWGYSNGEDLRYGMLGNDKMYRIQNTFCFFIKVTGYMIESDDEGQYGGSDITTTSKDKYQMWVPFQIDMETGLIY